MVLRVPWVTRSVIRAPFKRFRFLRAAVVSRSLTVTVPAPFAVADPMATTTDLLLLRTFAGTRPASLILPARATLTLIGTPLGPASAFVVTLLGTVATSAAPPGGGVPAVGGVPTVGGVPALGGWAAAGRNGATSVPPIAPCEAVGEITIGAEVSSHGSAAVVGVPATLRPPSSVHAMRVAGE